MTRASGLPDTPGGAIAGTPGGYVSGQFACNPNVYAPGTVSTLTVTSGTLAAWASGTVCTNPFFAPASGSVVVEVSLGAQVASGGTKIVFALAPAGSVSPIEGNVVNTLISSGTTLTPLTERFVVTGLTPGATCQFDLLGGTSGTLASVLALGSTAGTVSSAGAPVIMTVQAV